MTLSWLYCCWLLYCVTFWKESERSFLLKVRWTIYYTWWSCHGCVFVDDNTVWRSEKTVSVLFYLRSDGQYILVSNTIMAILFLLYCDVLVDSWRSFLLKVRWTVYFTWWHCHGCVFVDYYTVWRSDKTVDVLFYLRSDGQYILLGNTVMAVFFVDYYTVWRSDKTADVLFYLRSDGTIYFS